MKKQIRLRRIRVWMISAAAVAVLSCLTVFFTALGASVDSETVTAKSFESHISSDLVDPSHFMFKPNAVYNGNFRSELLDPEVMIYDAFVDHFVTRKQTDDITVNLEDAGYAAYDWDTARDMIISAYAAFFLDHPEMYWASSGFSMYDIYLRNNCVTSFTFSPSEAYTNAKSEMTTVNNGINAVVSEIASLRPSTSRYDTVKTIHDYICNKMTYDYGAAGSTYIGDAHSVAPLFGGGSRGYKYVCEGYARSLKLLCDRFNIPCVEVVGDAGGGHAWNYVQMEDGKWYAVDTTWDDQNPIMYTYFLIGKNTRVLENKKFSEDHTPENQALSTDTVNPLAYPALSDGKYEPGSAVEETFDFIGESAADGRILGYNGDFAWKYDGVITSDCKLYIYFDSRLGFDSQYYGGPINLFDTNGVFSTTFSLDTLTNGEHTVKAEFVKADGSVLTATRTIFVDIDYFDFVNWQGDNPEVSGDFEVCINDKVGYPPGESQVDLYLDGTQIYSGVTGNDKLVRYSINTRLYANGNHVLKAVFTNWNGVQSEKQKSFRIYNHPAFSFNTLGASIRLSEPWGIRFGIKLDKNDAFNNTQIIEYGTLIIASGTLGSNELTVDTPKVRKIKAANLLENDSTHITYTGVLINIPTSFFDTKVKGRGYLIYKGTDGNQHVYYSQIAEKSFNGVARAAYDQYSRIQNPTAAQKEALRKLKAILNIQ